ncbi:MAG: Flp family type IVb pilin [Clostridia bacterium]|nr:Flp family type IVb pilin [Clostridia bacterium]
MNKLKNICRNFIKDESGAETIEYVCIIAVVAGLIALVITGVVITLQNKINEANTTIGGIDANGGVQNSNGGGQTSVASTP